jgi:phage terminase Nu1 subunit (DNA packaging protein)
MAKGKGKKVNRTGLSEIFGVTAPTVDGWIRSGCPYDQRAAGKGKEWVFDSGDVAMWLQQRAREEASGEEVTDEKELKRRKLAAETAMAELELARAKALVAPVDEFERAQAKAFAIIQQNVMNVPQRVVLTLIGETKEARFKEVLRRELADALEKSASTELDDDDAE